MGKKNVQQPIEFSVPQYPENIDKWINYYTARMLQTQDEEKKYKISLKIKSLRMEQEKRNGAILHIPQEGQLELL